MISPTATARKTKFDTEFDVNVFYVTSKPILSMLADIMEGDDGRDTSF
jgi:hypothetical protein